MRNINFIKTIIALIFVVTIGTILRLIFIDKAEGLWNDEYISWHIASVPFGKGFLKAVFSQCHMPFYYLYLKFFIHLFGNSDLMLRLTSLLAGVASIFAMYFVGKEYKDEKAGILGASITSLSSFLIYFSQEVRLYEVLFFFSTLSLLFTLKLGKEKTISNLAMFILSNFMILFTHTIGFVFVFFNLIFMSLWAIKEDKKYKKPIIISWATMFGLFLALCPLLVRIFTTKSFSQWWGYFTVSKLGFLLTDYFSPIVTNIVNAPDSFFYNLTPNFVIFAILPTALAIFGVIKALQAKRYEITGLFSISLTTVLVLVLASLSGKLVFITKYSMEIYPILILLVAFGWLEIKNKALRLFVIFLFCFLNLFYLITNPNSAPKMHRAEGHKIVADLIKHAELKKDDIILFTYYSQEKFEKYFDFKNYRVISVTKGNFPQYLGTADYQKVLKDGKTIYKKTFEDSENGILKNRLEKEVIKNLKQNQKVMVIILNTVSLYSPIQMQEILKTEKTYEKTPLLFLVFSYIKNETLKTCLKSLQIDRIEQKGSWTAITFHKT